MILLNLQILFVSRKKQKRILVETMRAPNRSISEDHHNKKTRVRLGVCFFVDIKEAKTFSIVFFQKLLDILCSNFLL